MPYNISYIELGGTQFSLFLHTKKKRLPKQTCKAHIQNLHITNVKKTRYKVSIFLVRNSSINERANNESGSKDLRCSAEVDMGFEFRSRSAVERERESE